MSSLPAHHLEALTAIVDHGTFEAAARHLHLTASAVSQRVRALEAQVGQVVLRRTTPCRPTAAGETLLRLARQTALLQAETVAALGGLAGGASGGVVALPVAVTADALATWFAPVLAEVAGWPDTALRLHVEDQAYSADLLRAGDVWGAITSDPAPVQGCSSEPLGVLRYRAAASSVLASSVSDWTTLPVVVFNEKDALQHEALTRTGAGSPRVAHRVPTSADFAEAVRVGLGWGMLPEPQLAPLVATGEVVRLDAEPVDVTLHWQRWRLDTPVLARLTDAVRRAARAGLRPLRDASTG